MKYFLRSLIIILLFNSNLVKGQDSTAFKWEVSGKKIQDKVYELTFTTPGNSNWQLYGANEVISDVPAVELELADSSIQITKPFKEAGDNKAFKNPIFDNASFKIYEGKASFTATITFTGDVPAKLLGTFRYTYGKKDEFYPLNAYAFSVPLEGGVVATDDIRISSFDLKHPVNGCGDESTGDKGMVSIFFLGMLGGFIALFTPCVFPLIPLTVSFFTKKSQDKKKEIANATLYGFFIFLIYILLSIPFHLISGVNPEILNNISTNIWLNIFSFSFLYSSPYLSSAISRLGYPVDWPTKLIPAQA